MSRTVLLVAAGGSGLLMCGAGLAMLHWTASAERLARRLRRAKGLGEPAAEPGGGRAVLGQVARLGAAITRSGVLPRTTLSELRQTLEAAGFQAAGALPLFVGAKAGLAVCLPLLAAFLAPAPGGSAALHWLIVAASGVAGLLAPDYAIRNMRSRHLARVEAGLADALDMMVICAEAGIGLEPALVRVGAELRHAHPALADELARTSRDLQMSSDSRAALVGMSGRTGLECLRRLGTTLIQTMQYGTPLSTALRVLAAELRQEALTRFEERAARLPVLLTLPMILFILPCVFLVVGGPAAIQVAAALRH